MRRRTISSTMYFLLSIAFTFPVARADTYHNQLDSSRSGGITGTVKPAKGLQTVIAIEPFEYKAYQAKVNVTSGRFEFRGLPPGEYDLLIKTVGHVYEGVTLERDPSQTARSRDELKTVAAAAGNTFFTTEDYFHDKEILRLTFAGESARFIVVQSRSRKVVEPSGKKIDGHIRRIDLIEMVKTRKVWQVRKARHLLRQEVPSSSPDIQIKHTHLPKLGGILVGRKLRELGALDLAKLPRGDARKYAQLKYTESAKKEKAR